MRTGETIYLDHQATTPVDLRVLAAMMPYFRDAFGNPHSTDHYLGWQSARAVEQSAAFVARLIGADADEITFTSGATESNNLGVLGTCRAAANGPRRRVLLSAIEHKSVLSLGRVIAQQLGFTVEQIPVDRQGFVDVSVLDGMLADDVLLVSVMAVNNEVGTIQDTLAISDVVRRHGAYFHCDAAQAPVAMNTSSLARCADILSLSAHKMYGPKGIGAVYVSRDARLRIEPLLYGGSQQNGVRSGTVPTPLCVGMGMAAEILTEASTEERRESLRRLRDTFLEGLRSLGRPLEINGPVGKQVHPGNASVVFEGFLSHDILNSLQPHLAASTGSACSSGIDEPSHVLKAIGLDPARAESSIRFSLGFETTYLDVEEAVHLIGETLTRLARSGVRSA